MRPCYLAAGVRWMLRGDTPLSEKEKGDDIDLEKMVDYIRSGQVCSIRKGRMSINSRLDI